MYHDSFSFRDTSLVIEVASQSEVMAGNKNCWVEIYKQPFPAKDDKVTGEIFRD